jgi:hypothetical protein
MPKEADSSLNRMVALDAWTSSKTSVRSAPRDHDFSAISQQSSVSLIETRQQAGKGATTAEWETRWLSVSWVRYPRTAAGTSRVPDMAPSKNESVKLKAATMNDPLDALILSSASERWQKVARIIAVVSERVGDGTNFDAIAARIRALVGDGELQAEGDLSRWRYSEVRLPQSNK